MLLQPIEPAGEHPSVSILVVEDDTLLRFTVADYLRESGFEVLEASTANEAISVLTSDPDIHAVFSDVRMPGSMDGFDLAEWIEDNCPSLPIVLTSGYTGTRTGKQAHPVLPKPYSLDRVESELTKAIRRGTAERGRRAEAGASRD